MSEVKEKIKKLLGSLEDLDFLERDESESLHETLKEQVKEDRELLYAIIELLKREQGDEPFFKESCPHCNTNELLCGYPRECCTVKER